MIYKNFCFLKIELFLNIFYRVNFTDPDSEASSSLSVKKGDSRDWNSIDIDSVTPSGKKFEHSSEILYYNFNLNYQF